MSIDELTPKRNIKGSLTAITKVFLRQIFRNLNEREEVKKIILKAKKELENEDLDSFLELVGFYELPYYLRAAIAAKILDKYPEFENIKFFKRKRS